jgi:hypothetical protein
MPGARYSARLPAPKPANDAGDRAYQQHSVSPLPSGDGGTRLRLRNVLLTLQIVVSVVLLVRASLLMRSVQHAAAFDFGFVVDDLSSVSLDPPASYDPVIATKQRPRAKRGGVRRGGACAIKKDDRESPQVSLDAQSMGRDLTEEIETHRAMIQERLRIASKSRRRMATSAALRLTPDAGPPKAGRYFRFLPFSFAGFAFGAPSTRS